jgi:soluble lytic murein transglycosylase-like protein
MANSLAYPFRYPLQSTRASHFHSKRPSASLGTLIALILSGIAFVLSVQDRPRPPAPVAAKKITAPPAPKAKARTVVERRAGPEQGRIRAMADYLGKRYYVSNEAVHRLVETAFSVGHEVKLDPLLILAVMAIESRFNPIAESNAGAQGLMQVIPKYHADKVPDSNADASFLDPEVNVLVGAKVLKDYIARSGGNLQTGLQRYNGASSDASAQYANKVIAEKERLRQVFSRRARGAT